MIMSSIDLIDQRMLNRLSTQIKRERLASTYLFTGPELEKKKALAIAFAKALNCVASSLRGGRQADEAISEIASASPRNDVLNCDCSSCRRIDAGTHPDVKWYGADEEANSIKISDARDFKNWLNLKPYEGKVKVFIFNQAERLTGEAQNALLKSLEEPPPGNVILLLVPHTKSVYDTISSRAVEIKIPPFSSKEIQTILHEEGIAPEEADFLARTTQGELSRARELHEEGWFEEKNKWIDGLLENPVSFLEQFQSASRNEAEKLFSFLVEYLRDFLVLKASDDFDSMIHRDRFPEIHLRTKEHSLDEMMEVYEGINSIKKSIDDYANVKLAITNAEILISNFLKK
jgi:DNA polymerase-3 subunit delta'